MGIGHYFRWLVSTTRRSVKRCADDTGPLEIAAVPGLQRIMA
jgi:hypothetical protein